MVKIRLIDPRDPKRQLDGYDVIAELAHGGLATTFLGRPLTADGSVRLMVIKLVHPHLADDDPTFRDSFVREADRAAAVQHPNVVPVRDAGHGPRGAYLAMDYIEGDSLGRLHALALAKAAPIPRPVLFRVLLDALYGIHAVHEACDARGTALNLVHGDMWPQNILVGEDGRARVADFALARAGARLPNLGADRLKGKASYVSPERARGLPVDRRSDIFSMGVILWEMLTGLRLFKAESEARMLFNVTACNVPALSATVLGISGALDRLCNQALARDPDQRFRTAADMAASLEHALKHVPPARQPSVASHSEVAAYFHANFGADLLAQRENIRKWLEQRSRTPAQIYAAGPGWSGPAQVQILRDEEAGPLPVLRSPSTTETALPVYKNPSTLEGADTEDGETRLMGIDDDFSTGKGAAPGRSGGESSMLDVSSESPTISRSLIDTDRELTTFYDGGTTGAGATAMPVPVVPNEPWRNPLLTPLGAVVVGFGLGLVLLVILLNYPPSILRAPASTASQLRSPTEKPAGSSGR